MGVWRHWRYTKEKMERLIDEGRVIQTRPGNVPQYKRYLDEMPGVPVQTVWTDIDVINNRSRERLGYPTQKPVALLERIILASSHEGDTVLDPFCGCGTTIDAAQKHARSWIGIDVTYLAVDLIDKRLRHTYGSAVAGTYEVIGIPRDVEGARALFHHNAFEFERWAVSLVNGQPNLRQVGDRGVDGVIRFPIDARGGTGRALASVKGGRQINPAMVRDLVGTVESQRAQMGVLITMEPPTPGMVDAANHSGIYTTPYGQSFPKVQIITVPQLLAGQRPKLPPTIDPYFAAQRRAEAVDQLALDSE